MKKTIVLLVVTLTQLALIVFLVPPLHSCLICEDVITSDEASLEKLIREKGRAVLPDLRDIITCPKESDVRLKVIAVRAIGKFKDRESIPLLNKIVLQILAPGSDSRFGVATTEHSMRVEATTGLAGMKATGIEKAIWAKWAELSPSRQEEVPRLLSALNPPDAQEKLRSMLRSARDVQVAFQVIVELRRSGDRRAIPEVNSRLEAWKKWLGEKNPVKPKPRHLSRMVRYTENTLRFLKRR